MESSLLNEPEILSILKYQNFCCGLYHNRTKKKEKTKFGTKKNRVANGTGWCDCPFLRLLNTRMKAFM
jgi:hypothetical protein